jgi:hypothetical protein
MTAHEYKHYMLGLSVMARLTREENWVGDILDPSVLDSIVDDAIDLELLEVSDKGEIILP